MGLSATEITNSTAGTFDVELKFYGGLAYSALTLSTYITGAIDPSTAAWQDLTARVKDAGSLTYERAGNSLRWTAAISGTQYAAAYFAPGQAILCLRRILVAGTQTVPASGTWELWWVGQVLSGGHEDDYKHGGSWSRSISGLDSLLQSSTAPRLTAGRVNLMANASVSASSILANAALEAGTGEFVGTLVSCAAANTIDGNINTLWISDTAPHADARAVGTGRFQKVFCKPLTGYNQAKLWWIEVRNLDAGGDVYLENAAGTILHLNSGDVGEPVRSAGTGTVIIAASRSDFEAYTGGAQSGAIVVDAKSHPYQGTFNSLYNGRDGTFTLDPSADIVYLRRSEEAGVPGVIRHTICWNQTGAAPAGLNVNSTWTGGAKDISDDLCPPGSGIWCKANEDGNSAADWEITNMLMPGQSYTANSVEWLLYTLQEQPAALDGSVTAGATTITLNSTMGLLDAGTAITETDTFTYTGRTSTTLTGVSGIGNHATGAAVRQYIGGVAQTGWPCSQLELLRPANSSLPGIVNGRVYLLTSGLTAPATPDDENWEVDYDGSVLLLYTANVLDTVMDYGRLLNGPDGGPRWTMYVLVVFDGMTGDARARLNECKLYLAQTQIDSSGLGDIDTLTACALAQYIFNQAGSTTSLSRGTSLDAGPYIGEHATAIAPYPQVLDDLARITGCVMDWDLAGTPTWWPDMWWPTTLTTAQLSTRAALDATYLRGKAQYSGHRPSEAGVKIHARTPDGNHEYTVQYPKTLTSAQQRMEFDDLVVTNANSADELARMQYYKAGLFYTAGPQELTFTLKGPGEWLRPDQWITLACYNQTGEVVKVADLAAGQYNVIGWLTESVTWEWGRQGAFRSWKATARCRRYWR